MRAVCAWCLADLGERPGPDGATTHGICPACLATIRATCPWEYPATPHRICGAPATLTVRYRVDGRSVRYCLSHAQREVLGGQAEEER